MKYFTKSNLWKNPNLWFVHHVINQNIEIILKDWIKILNAVNAEKKRVKTPLI